MPTPTTTASNEDFDKITGIRNTAKVIDANIIIQTQRKSGERLKVVAFGDSITAVGSSDAPYYLTRLSGYWVFADMLTKGNFDFLQGKGISGNTTLDLLARMDDVLLSGADICVLMIGTNDVGAGRTSGDILTSLIDIVTQINNAGIEVVLLPITYRESSGFYMNTQIEEINKLYKTYIEPLTNSFFVDNGNAEFNRYMNNDDVYSVTEDKLHPNTFGSWLIAGELARKLDTLYTSYLMEKNVLSNFFLDGTDGSLNNGAIGEVPTGFIGYYCTYSKKIISKSVESVIVELGILEANYRSTFVIVGIPIVSSKKYYGKIVVSIPDFQGIDESACFFRLLSQNGSQNDVYFHRSMTDTQGNSVDFNNVVLKTPVFFNDDSSTYGNLYFSMNGDKTIPVKYEIRSMELIEI